MNSRRVNLNSKFQLQKCQCDKMCHSEDWISRLPDEIVVVIMSSLPLIEFARTSILSSAWTKVWTHTLCLNFDAEEVLHRIAGKTRKIFRSERSKYINWVNSVLQSHKGLTLEEFRICFPVGKSERKAITRWLKFAFATQVQRLELNLLKPGDLARHLDRTYDFPAQFISCGAAVKSLKSLRLKAVNVSGDDIAFFLRECPLLEELIVQGSHKLTKLEVRGPSLALKHLEVCYCYPHYATHKISAPNLTTLKVMPLAGLLLENVPKLVEVYLICLYDDFYVRNFAPTLALCISQLEVLTLHLAIPSCQEMVEPWDFPQLPKLKKLNITTDARKDRSLIGLTSFIRASPHLQEFEVKLYWCDDTKRESRVEEAMMHFPHEQLKVLKFWGYYGRSSDFEVVRYILANCVALEKIIIDTRYQHIVDAYTPAPEEFRDAENSARSLAKNQLSRVPDHIQLLII